MPGFKDRMKAIKEHFKPPKRTKPDPKGCFEAAGEQHIKRPTQTKPESKGCFKAIKEHFKPPKQTKPDPKGCFEAAGEHIKRPTQTKPESKGCFKAIKEYFKPPKQTKPDPKGCFEATREHIKRPTQTKPESKGCLEAAGEHIKRPTQTKPESKGCLEATAKPFPWMLPCVKHQKDEDDCPGLPEVKTSYIDEEIPESLASQSYISLTDSESDDDCAAVADLGFRSDSLEGIPKMLEAESLPSLMENKEEEEAEEKGKDGEKDLGSHDACPVEAEPNPGPTSDGLPQPQVTDAEEASPDTLEVDSLSSLTGSDAGPCPAEADPGPSSDRVPEPQGRTSDEERCVQESDMNNSNCSMTEDDLHLMCNIFNTSSKEKKRSLADGIASKCMDLMLEHFLKSEETACDKLMYAVFASPKCSLGMCLDEFIVTLSENQIQDSEELPLAKLKALRGIRAIVRDHGDIKILNDWLSCHFVALTNILVSHFEPKKQGTSRKPKMYLVPGEAIDIFAILLQRLNLMHKMMSVFNPR